MSDPSSAPAEAPQTRSPTAPLRHLGKRRLLMLLLGLIVGTEFLENGMFVFAASHIMGGIDAAPAEFAQVLAAYAIGSLLMIVSQQWLSRHFGYRRYLFASLALFTLGALGCAFCSNLQEMTLARLLQGFGGGALFTSSRVLVPQLFSVRERPLAVKHFMLMLFGLSAAGPALAAALVENDGWRSVFLVVVPLALLAMAGAWWLLPDAVGRGERPVRWAAAPLLLFAAAITLVQTGLAQARYAFFSDPIRLSLLAAAGLALLGAFIWQQWRHDEPLLRVRDLAHPAYFVGLGLYFMHYAMSGASSYLFPVLAERGLGLPLATVGWLNTFAAALGLATAYAYIKLGSRFANKKPLMLAGALAMALAAWLFSRIAPAVPAGALLPALTAKGVASALLVLPVAGLTFRELGEQRFAHAYQGKNLMRQIAQSIAPALAAIALEDREFANQSSIAAAAQAGDWLQTLQAGLSARGLPQADAHLAAMANVSQQVAQQALLASCADLYRLLAVVALGTALAVLAQRRLR